MINIRVADFTKDSEIKTIRTEVFIKEQGVPIELEWDKSDESATHILAYIDNQAVATARMLKDGHIGRMAVLKDYRLIGIGQAMIEYFLDLASKSGLKKVRLSSQEHATRFYEKSGFTINSDVYQDAGIPHYDMIYKVKN